MINIMEWLDKEQEHKLILWNIQKDKNRVKDLKRYNKAIAMLNIECVKLCRSGVGGIHPEILKRYGV